MLSDILSSDAVAADSDLAVDVNKAYAEEKVNTFYRADGVDGPPEMERS